MKPIMLASVIALFLAGTAQAASCLPGAVVACRADVDVGDGWKTAAWEDWYYHPAKAVYWHEKYGYYRGGFEPVTVVAAKAPVKCQCSPACACGCQTGEPCTCHEWSRPLTHTVQPAQLQFSGARMGVFVRGSGGCASGG